MLRTTLAILLVACAPAAFSGARQVTHGNDSDPSFAPDGRRMIVVTSVNGREQLSILSVEGTERKVLTTGAEDHEDPAWSPDGRHIAYVLKGADSEVIHMMDTDGSHDRPLTPATQRTIHPAWSRDSARILYCTDDDLKPPLKNTSEIYSIDLATLTAKPIISGGVNTYPSLSPDGTRIAFRRMLPGNNSEVFIAASDGTQVRNLTNHPAFDGWPDWSPDGQRIAFASNRDGNHKICAMNPDGSGVRLLADTPGRGTAPRWSPDGAEIFFTVCQRDNTGPHCEIYSESPPAPGGRR